MSYIPPYGPSLPDWMRQVSSAANPALNRVVAQSDFGPLSVTIREAYNPDDLTGWTDTAAAENYEGFSVDLGGYGTRAFGPDGIPTAIVGATSIPVTATTAPHAVGVAGYAKSASTTTGAVGVYGEGNVAGAGANAWGINTRVQDQGYAPGQIWGYECDVNVDHAGTVAVGIDALGGSTAIPDAASPAYRVGPIGTFANPAIPWGRGVFIDDGAALTGIEVGAQMRVGDTGASSKPSQPIYLYYLNGGGARTLGLTLQVNSSGVGTFTGRVGLASLGNYANDAAAAAGGVAIGELYRNASVVMVRVV